MRSKFTFYILFSFIGIIFICIGIWSCNDTNSNIIVSDVIESYGMNFISIYKIEFDDPYLFACAGVKGLWRRNVRNSTVWEYLGFADSNQSDGYQVGVTDVDARGNDILLLYCIGDASTINPNLVGIWRSKDFGETFIRSDSGIVDDAGERSHFILSIERSRLNPLVGLASYGTIFRTVDGGGTWSRISQPYSPGSYEDLRWHPKRASEVWQFGQTGFFESFISHFKEGGLKYIPIDSLPPELFSMGSLSPVLDISFDAVDTNTIYVANRTLLKSTDNGRRWFFPMGVRSLYFKILLSHPNYSNVLYLSTGLTIYLSTDGGASVKSIAKIENGVITSLAIDPGTNILYISTSKGIFKLSP